MAKSSKPREYVYSPPSTGIYKLAYFANEDQWGRRQWVIEKSVYGDDTVLDLALPITEKLEAIEQHCLEILRPFGKEATEFPHDLPEDRSKRGEWRHSKKVTPIARDAAQFLQELHHLRLLSKTFDPLHTAFNLGQVAERMRIRGAEQDTRSGRRSRKCGAKGGKMKRISPEEKRRRRADCESIVRSIREQRPSIFLGKLYSETAKLMEAKGHGSMSDSTVKRILGLKK